MWLSEVLHRRRVQGNALAALADQVAYKGEVGGQDQDHRDQDE
jgi:hypothetical protein